MHLLLLKGFGATRVRSSALEASANARRGFAALRERRPVAAVIKNLEPRWFVVRNAHDREGVKLVMPRYAMSFMKGPMTRGEIRRALGEGAAGP